MTWETFDADWDAEDGCDDPNLPYTAAYTRDDGIRLEMYTWEGIRVIEVSDNATHDVLAKALYADVDGTPTLLSASHDWWKARPSIGTAALRYAARVWQASPLAADVVIP